VFGCSGYQLGSTVTIPAGVPVTVSNASPLYIMGTDAKRYEGRTYFHGLVNFAPTIAEWRSVFINGIPNSWKWGSQTAVYTSNFSAGVDSVTAVYTGTTLTGNTDSINGSDDWLKVERTDVSAGSMAINRTTTAVIVGYRHYALITIYNPIESTIGYFKFAIADGTNNYINIVPVAANSEVTALYYSNAGINTNIIIAPCDSNGGGVSSAQGQIYYVKNINIYKQGFTFALESNGIQPVGANAQWLDSSTNKLDATLPVAGCTNVQKIDQGRYKWSTAMTDDTTLTAIVPAGFKLVDFDLDNSTGNTCTLRLGTTAGGSDVVASISVAASTVTPTVVNKLLSKTADTTLYLSDTGAGWGSCSLTATLFFRRFN
jgi:hypothetical protein